MAGTMDRSPSTIPHLPNELRIRILSFIDDPHFLWTTCRKVSRAFKNWSEEQYSRHVLPEMLVHMSITPPVGHEHVTVGRGYQRSEFIFHYKKPSPTDSALVLLQPENLIFSVIWDEMRAQGRKVPEKTSYPLLDDLGGSLGQFADCWLFPETALGLRPQEQNHVCPCRSIRDGTRRGRCQRYNGIGQFFAWRKEEKVLVVRWKEMLDYVHYARCVDAVPVSKKRALESIA